MTRLIAWLGGALFVTSLALTAWWYFIQLGYPAPFTDWRAPATDALLVTIFAGHHSVFARERVKRAMTLVPPALLRSWYVWIASALLILVVVLWRPVGGVLYEVTGPRRFVHAALQVFGIWVIVQAVSGLDPLELAGIRQASHASPRNEPLQITGPYRWVRHPLYLGWMLTLFGAAQMTGDRLAFAAFTSLYLVVAIRWEERSLRQSFGPEYDRYAERVRWRVLPFLY
jgi:methanethiol S-methyltransferase